MTRHYYEGRNGQSKIKYVEYNWNTLFNLAQDYWEVSPAEYLDLHSDIKNVLGENWNVNTAKCDELAEKYLKTKNDDNYDAFCNAFRPYPMNEDTILELVQWDADRNARYVVTLEDDELELAKKRGIVNWGYEIEDLQQLKDIKAAFQFADALKMLKEAAKNNTQGWKNKIGNFRN